MKKRIIALGLVVVMSLLALSSCGSYNFASENLGDYAQFDFAGFDAAIKAIQIKDGEFTTNTDTREKLVKQLNYLPEKEKPAPAPKPAAAPKAEAPAESAPQEEKKQENN